MQSQTTKAADDAPVAAASNSRECAYLSEQSTLWQNRVETIIREDDDAGGIIGGDRYRHDADWWGRVAAEVDHFQPLASVLATDAEQQGQVADAIDSTELRHNVAARNFEHEILGTGPDRVTDSDFSAALVEVCG